MSSDANCAVSSFDFDFCWEFWLLRWQEPPFTYSCWDNWTNGGRGSETGLSTTPRWWFPQFILRYLRLSSIDCLNLIFGLFSYFNFDGTTLKKELIHSKLLSVLRDSEGTGKLTAFSLISSVCVCVWRLFCRKSSRTLQGSDWQLSITSWWEAEWAASGLCCPLGNLLVVF